MGMRAGLDRRTLYGVFGVGSAQNTLCDKLCPVPGIDSESPSSHGYMGGFRAQLMLRDFTLAMDMAKRVGAKNIVELTKCSKWSLMSWIQLKHFARLLYGQQYFGILNI